MGVLLTPFQSMKVSLSLMPSRRTSLLEEPSHPIWSTSLLPMESKKLEENLCYVALDIEADKQKAASSSEIQKAYELPDGQTINVNAPRFMGPEALFNPGLIKEGDETPGMHTMCN